MSLRELEKLLPTLDRLTTLAKDNGIEDVFQDNNLRILQIKLVLGLKILPGRCGNDLINESGTQYEVKTTTANSRAFATHHHLTADRINKYSKIPWLFGIFEGFRLKTVYEMAPGELDDVFMTWLLRMDEMAPGAVHLNNPKISLSYVQNRGQILYEAPYCCIGEARSPQ